VANYGIKEVAWLKQIETASHKAVFSLENRKDGKGANYSFDVVDVEVPIGDPDNLTEDPHFTPSTESSDHIWSIENSNDLWINLPGIYADGIEAARERDNNVVFASIAFHKADGTVLKNAGIKYSHVKAKRPTSNGVDVRISPSALGASGWATIQKITIESAGILWSARSYDISNILKCISNIKLYDKMNPTSPAVPVRTVTFGYDYTLCPGTPNSSATEADGGAGAKLTLKTMQVAGLNGATYPPYQFSYQTGTTGNPPYGDMYHHDNWGMYKSDGTHSNDLTSQDAGSKIGIAWNLISIATPTGTQIGIDYERDEYRGVNAFGVPAAHLIDNEHKWVMNNRCFHYYRDRGGHPDDRADPTTGEFEVYAYGIYNAGGSISVGQQAFIYVPQAFDRWRNHIFGHFVTGPYQVIEVGEYDPDSRRVPVRLDTDNHWIFKARELSGQHDWGYGDGFELILPMDEMKFYGGGERVSKLTVKAADNSEISTKYAYSQEDGQTSGSVLKAPPCYSEDHEWSFFKYQAKYRPYRPNGNDGESEFDKENIGHTIDASGYRERFELPGSGVVYGTLSETVVDESSNPLAGKTVYDNHTPRETITINGEDVPMFFVEFSDDNTMTIRDYTAICGKPKSVRYYANGNDAPLASRQFTYAFSEDNATNRPEILKKGIALSSSTAPGLIAQSHRFNLNYAETPTAFKTVKHMRNHVYLTGVRTIRDGVPRLEETTALDAFTGRPLKSATGLDGGPNKKRITSNRPAYWYPEYFGMVDRNMLKQGHQKITYEDAENDASAVASSATTWSNTAGSSTSQWYVDETKVWHYERCGGTRTPEFFARDGGQSCQWMMMNKVEKYDKHGRKTTVLNPEDVPTSITYNPVVDKPSASATNAHCGQWGVFTGDYNVGEGGYFDKENGWGHHDAPGGTVRVTADRSHFGSKSLYVHNARTAVKTIEIDDLEGRFRRSAWVYPVSSNPIRFAGQLFLNGTPQQAYYNYVYDQSEGLRVDEWQLVEFEFAIDEPTEGSTAGLTIDKTKWNGVYTWIGNHTFEPAAEFYMDDLRFYPADALVTSTYYHPVFDKPTLTVDANNNPSQLVEYDGLGRPVRWYKIEKTKSAGDEGYKTLLKEKEYHLAGEPFYVNHFEADDDPLYRLAANACSECTYVNGSPGGKSGACALLHFGAHQDPHQDRLRLDIPDPDRLAGASYCYVRGYLKVPAGKAVGICVFRYESVGSPSDYEPIATVEGTGAWEEFNYVFDCGELPTVEKANFAVQARSTGGYDVGVDELQVGAF
jgi:hypothetical protein